jgi:hypothetical protein
MTQSDKRKASAYMKSIMADQTTVFSHRPFHNKPVPLYKKGVINWSVFLQLMFVYFGHTQEDDTMPIDEKKYIQNWGKRYKNKRDKEMNKVLMDAIGDE